VTTKNPHLFADIKLVQKKWILSTTSMPKRYKLGLGFQKKNEFIREQITLERWQTYYKKKVKQKTKIFGMEKKSLKTRPSRHN